MKEKYYCLTLLQSNVNNIALCVVEVSMEEANSICNL